LPSSGGLPVFDQPGCILRLIFSVRIHDQNGAAHMFLVDVVQPDRDGALMTEIAPQS